jgi:cell division protein FtsL
MIYIWISGFLLLLVMLHLYIFTKSMTYKYEITDLKMKFKELKGVNRLLAGKLSEAESLPKLEQKALSMDMQYPEEINYIIATGESR